MKYLSPGSVFIWIVLATLVVISVMGCAATPPATPPAPAVAVADDALGRITRGLARNDAIRARTAALLRDKKLQPAQAKNARYLADVAWTTLDHAETLYAEGKLSEAAAALDRADTAQEAAERQNAVTQDKPKK